MLMSMMSAPAASAIRAPSDIQWASQPASCTTCRPTPCPSARNRAPRRPFTKSAGAGLSGPQAPEGRIRPARHGRQNDAIGKQKIGGLGVHGTEELVPNLSIFAAYPLSEYT